MGNDKKIDSASLNGVGRGRGVLDERVDGLVAVEEERDELRLARALEADVGGGEAEEGGRVRRELGVHLRLARAGGRGQSDMTSA